MLGLIYLSSATITNKDELEGRGLLLSLRGGHDGRMWMVNKNAGIWREVEKTLAIGSVEAPSACRGLGRLQKGVGWRVVISRT